MTISEYGLCCCGFPISYRIAGEFGKLLTGELEAVELAEDEK